jgi:hypothetical protein
MVDTSASAVGIGNCPTNDANLGRVVEERWGETRLRQVYVAASFVAFPQTHSHGAPKHSDGGTPGRATASRRVSQNNGAQGLTALSSVWLKPSEQMGFRSETEEGCIALPALAHGGPTRFSWRLRTVAATKFYSASCCSADSASALRSFIAALRLSLTRPFSSIPIHFTQTRSPIFTTSSTFLTLKSASSEI